MTIRAIILSGGRSSRFGGVHKPGVELGGTSVISRILTAVRTADPAAEVWVAGPTEGLSETETESVRSVREEPVFAGPLAGIAAAASAMERSVGDAEPSSGDAETEAGDTEPSSGDTEPAEDDVTLVLAGDMPLITAGHLGELVDVCRQTNSPVAGEDERGKAQFLCSAWPHRLLLTRLEAIGDPANGAVRRLFDGLDPVLVDVDPTVVADFDTTEELAGIRPHFDDGI